ncbi:hypothetical protein QAD02_009739 [Eretmocerus hayati]|uniref:Uncharacterized protein n=1 Tax=Eretmocerus hayati TaxID=131215 RepID=A0ACC2NAJ3_9HYME|nr:hypothetical protein QAD02_009739 [Eretmocerus hayati]
MFSKLGILLLTTYFLGTVNCQDASESVNAALEKAQEIASQNGINLNLTNLNGLNLTSLNISALPIGKAEDALREKCTKNGGSYDDAKDAGMKLIACTKDIVNFNTLQQEIKDNTYNGDLDKVFKKYCKKQPTVEKCLKDFAEKIEPCLEPVEKQTKQTLDKITKKILDFVCFKEGDRIAMFVAAKGPECFKEKVSELRQCGNKTFSGYAKSVAFNPADGIAGAVQQATSLFDPEKLPLLVFDQERCSNLQSFQKCSVEELELCEDPTPANLIDSIFNYIKKVTPCEQLLKGGSPQAAALTMEQNSASKNSAFAAILLAAIAAIFA